MINVLQRIIICVSCIQYAVTHYSSKPKATFAIQLLNQHLTLVFTVMGLFPIFINITTETMFFV